MTRPSIPPSNNNEPPAGRRIVIDVPQDLPIFSAEFALVEAHFAAMIEELRRTVANDDATRPKEETRA